jgi:hypothetical protein
MLLGNPTRLSTKAQEDLLRWIVLKLMVLERRVGSKPVFTREEAIRFRADRTIPNNLNVDLLYTVDDRLRSVLHRESAAIPPTVDPNPDLIITNIQAVVLGIGRLLVYARHAQLDNLRFKRLSPNIAASLSREPSEEISWPPPNALTYDDVQYLNGAMGRFLADMTPI